MENQENSTHNLKGKKITPYCSISISIDTKKRLIDFWKSCDPDNEIESWSGLLNEMMNELEKNMENSKE